MLGFYEAMQNHTIKLTPPAASRCRLSSPVTTARVNRPTCAVVGDSPAQTRFSCGGSRGCEDPTRVLTETIFELMGITPRCTAGRRRRSSTNINRCLCHRRVLPAAGKTTGDALADGRGNSAHTLAKLATPFAEGEALVFPAFRIRNTLDASRSSLAIRRAGATNAWY